MKRGLCLNLDVDCSRGFPSPVDANADIFSVTLQKSDTGEIFVWGLVSYGMFYTNCIKAGVNANGVVYTQSTNEFEILESVTAFIEEYDGDYINGWNSSRFDLVYLCHRMRKLGIECGRLSKSGIVRDKKVQLTATHWVTVMQIDGVDDIDCMDVYKKLVNNEQDTYRLDHTTTQVFGGERPEYDDYGVSYCRQVTSLCSHFNLIDMFYSK